MLYEKAQKHNRLTPRLCQIRTLKLTQNRAFRPIWHNPLLTSNICQEYACFTSKHKSPSQSISGEGYEKNVFTPFINPKLSATCGLISVYRKFLSCASASSSSLNNRVLKAVILIAVLLLSLTAGFARPAAAASDAAFGAVYTLTNAASGNEVLVYNRSSDGSIAFQGAYATGGSGSGAGLGSQTALILSENNHWLFAVNAGSDQVSAFAVNADGLELVDVVDSGGTLPVSLTAYKDWLYVLNAGGSGNIK